MVDQLVHLVWVALLQGHYGDLGAEIFRQVVDHESRIGEVRMIIVFMHFLFLLAELF